MKADKPIFDTSSPDWQTPSVSSINRMAAHSPLSSWRGEVDALANKTSQSLICLDGQWQFYLFDRPEEVPDSWLLTDLGSEKDIAVPGNWQMQGYDYPIYTNVKYPFP
jgi:beta-galactosidase